MANLSIPEKYRPGLVKLSSLEEESFDRLVTALESLPQVAKIEDISDDLSHKVPEVAKEDLEKILMTLSSLYFVRLDGDVPATRLASDVSDAMQLAGDEKLKLSEPDRAGFRDRLERLLNVDSLSPVSKAVGLRADFPNLFCDAKIITDLRPIFGKPEDPPVGGIVTHTLRLGYHQSREHLQLYVTLDEEDISNLKKVLARAESKAASLKAFLRKAGIPDLESKA